MSRYYGYEVSDRPYHYDTAPAYRRDTFYGTSYAPHTQRVYEEHGHPYTTVNRHYDRRTAVHRDYAPVTSYEPYVVRHEGPTMGIHRSGLGRPHHFRKSKNITPVDYHVGSRPVTRYEGYDHYESRYVPHDTYSTGVQRHTVARDYTHYDATPVRYDVDTYTSGVRHYY